jgi:metal-responsive CopG/Arc/MetJ family transcriptional regulator
MKKPLDYELKVRMPASDVKDLDAIADSRTAGITRSDVIREAVAQYLSAPAQQASEALKKSGRKKLDRADKAESKNQE